MIYQAEQLSVTLLEDGIAELKYDAKGPVNKFDQATLQALTEGFDTKDKDGKTIKDSWLKNATISQMYLPESLKLIEEIASPSGSVTVPLKTRVD